MESSVIASVSRAVRVLERLSKAKQGLTVTEVSQQLGVTPSVVFRILGSLIREGYVTKDPVTERYLLTFKLPTIGYNYMETLGFPEFCQPVLQELANETGELSELAVVERDMMRIVAKAEGGQRIRVHAILGVPVVLHAAASGKVWLASLPEEQALALALRDGLTPVTPSTITGIDELRLELARIRERGYAISREEMMEEVYSLAAPVVEKEDNRMVVGAVILVAPKFRTPVERLEAFAPRVIEAARLLGRTWPSELSLSEVAAKKLLPVA